MPCGGGGSSTVVVFSAKEIATVGRWFGQAGLHVVDAQATTPRPLYRIPSPLAKLKEHYALAMDEAIEYVDPCGSALLHGLPGQWQPPLPRASGCSSDGGQSRVRNFFGTQWVKLDQGDVPAAQ